MLISGSLPSGPVGPVTPGSVVPVGGTTVSDPSPGSVTPPVAAELLIELEELLAILELLVALELSALLLELDATLLLLLVELELFELFGATTVKLPDPGRVIGSAKVTVLVNMSPTGILEASKL